MSVHYTAEQIKPFLIYGYSGVLPESKSFKIFQLCADIVSQQSPCGRYKVRTDRRSKLFQIPVNIFELVIIQIKAQRTVVIKHRSHSDDIHCIIVRKHSEISQMPVNIQDKTVKYAHSPEIITAANIFKKTEQ